MGWVREDGAGERLGDVAEVAYFEEPLPLVGVNFDQVIMSLDILPVTCFDTDLIDLGFGELVSYFSHAWKVSEISLEHHQNHPSF